MFKNLVFVAILISVASVGTVVAGPNKPKCKEKDVVGSYTSATPNIDIFGNGTVFHSFTNQLNLNSGGTALIYWTGYNDYLINLGTGSPFIGSWSCQKDGTLLVNLIAASYLPSTPSGDAPNPDVTLFRHFRLSQTYSVDDDNTLTRTQSRTRRYDNTQDPTDPSGGVLLPVNLTLVTYTRLSPSDADLLAP